MTSITQSMLGSADTCMRSFQYGLQRPTWVRQVGGSDRAVGTGFHAGLALYYTQRIDKPSALPDTAEMITEAVRIFNVSTELDLYDNTPIEKFKWSEKVPDLATAEKLIGQLIAAYIDNGWWLGLEHEIVAVELAEHFTDPESGRTFKLGADLVSRLGNTLRLTDHKTTGKAWSVGKESPRKQNQSPLYTWAARQKWADADVIEFAFDIIALPGPRTPVRFERRITTPSPAHEAAVVGKALDLMNLYETVVVGQGRDLPANPASALCNPKWCDYWTGCPHGAALDSSGDILTISSTLAPTPVALPERAPRTAPDEGRTGVNVDSLRDKYKALDPAARAWVETKRNEAQTASVDFHLSTPTERRAWIMSALMSLAVAELDDDTVKAIARHILGDNHHDWPTITAGHAVGTLDHVQAKQFRDLALVFASGMGALEFDHFGAKVAA